MIAFKEKDRKVITELKQRTISEGVKEYFSKTPLVFDNSSSDKALCGYKEISNFLGISTKTLRRHLRLLPISRLGKHILVLESDLKRWIQQNSKKRFSKKK